MKFNRIKADNGSVNVTEDTDLAAIEADYRTARQIGVLRIGEDSLFFRSGFKKYYMPYSDIHRVFRRVIAVPAKLCCGNGNFEIENLVIAEGGTELAQIQLPGTRAADEVMRVLKNKLPDADFTALHADPENVKQGTNINQ
ncbi:MAG: hypothetical protein J5966_01530 [Lachnospiraceae bacterium]|nr:hypothetical protein [Lachnospiraceae bacterium]